MEVILSAMIQDDWRKPCRPARRGRRKSGALAFSEVTGHTVMLAWVGLNRSD